MQKLIGTCKLGAGFDANQEVMIEFEARAAQKYVNQEISNKQGYQLYLEEGQ